MNTSARLKPRARAENRSTPAAAAPHVAVADGVLDDNRSIQREADDTSADVEARQRLADAAFRVARLG